MAGRLWLCACRAGPVLVTGEAWRKPWLTAVSQAQAKVFISTPKDTGPAYTQMQIQHRFHRQSFHFTGKVFISTPSFSTDRQRTPAGERTGVHTGAQSLSGSRLRACVLSAVEILHRAGSRPGYWSSLRLPGFARRARSCRAVVERHCWPQQRVRSACQLPRAAVEQRSPPSFGKRRMEQTRSF